MPGGKRRKSSNYGEDGNSDGENNERREEYA